MRKDDQGSGSRFALKLCVSGTLDETVLVLRKLQEGNEGGGGWVGAATGYLEPGKEVFLVLRDIQKGDEGGEGGQVLLQVTLSLARRYSWS